MIVHVLGVPMDLGSGRRGVDMGPSAIRIAGVEQRLRELGHTVIDEGDITIKNMEELKVGDDHSIAAGTVSGIAAFCRRKGKRLGLLWVDAHGDINTPESSPSGNIHGMPVAALLGEGPPELTAIGGDGPKLEPRNIAMVAIRSLDEGEKVRLKRHGVQVHTMSQVDRHGIEQVMKEALARVSDGTDRVHVSFDLDALDPEVAP